MGQCNKVYIASAITFSHNKDKLTLTMIKLILASLNQSPDILNVLFRLSYSMVLAFHKLSGQQELSLHHILLLI